LDVNDLSVHRAEMIEQAADTADHRLHTWPMALTTLHLHIDNDETRRLRLQFDLIVGHQRIPPRHS
jgi:hypothetical protein